MRRRFLPFRRERGCESIAPCVALRHDTVMRANGAMGFGIERRRVFAALENRAYLGQLLDRVASTGTVQVFIGAENAPEEMRDVSLVLAPYGEPGRAVGVVGVLGPTRMGYRQAIGTVRFVSTLMNELVHNIDA